MATDNLPISPMRFDKSDGIVSHNENVLPAKPSRAPISVLNLTPEQRAQVEKALVRKIDLRLLPMIVLMYIMNYLDRNNIAAAKLAGILTDLHLKGTEFQVCSLHPSE